MLAPNQPWNRYAEILAAAGRSLLESTFRHGDILMRRVVIAASVGIFGTISLISGNGSILILSLVPIIAFEYVLHG